MISNSKKVAIAATTFGAALTSLYAAPELSAQGIIDLTLTPRDANDADGFLDGFGSLLATSAGGGFAGAGSILINNTGMRNVEGTNSGIGFLAQVAEGVTLQTSTFNPTRGAISFSSSFTGNVFFGFRRGDNIGFFELDFGDIDPDTFEAPITATGLARFNTTPGGSISVAAVPEPSGGALAALALGALGLRRNRKK